MNIKEDEKKNVFIYFYLLSPEMNLFFILHASLFCAILYAPHGEFNIRAFLLPFYQQIKNNNEESVE